jgi:hypothetical protein
LRHPFGYEPDDLFEERLLAGGCFVALEMNLAFALVTNPGSTDFLFFASEIDGPCFGTGPVVTALGIGSVSGAAEGIDFFGHDSPKGFPHGGAKDFGEQFSRFSFSSLQKGGFQFFVGHGGGWVWFEHRHASAWLTNRHLFLRACPTRGTKDVA